MESYVIDVQGHRGCRGLLPENTIPAFKKALTMGLTTLELDIVVSKDHKIIVSHEPFFSHEISKTPDGNPIPLTEEKSHNLFQLDYDQIKKYDVGSLFHSRFPDQEKINVAKPSLNDLVLTIESKTKELGRTPILYNIELKRKPEYDGIFLPDVHSFVDLVLKEISDLNIESRVTLQCFDIECLQIIHKKAPTQSLVYLIQNTLSPKENLERLGFMPSTYSPYFKLVTPSLVDFCNKQKIKLVPWTVNKLSDMQKMLDFKVDGIITDYPNQLIELIESKPNVEIQ